VAPIQPMRLAADADTADADADTADADPNSVSLPPMVHQRIIPDRIKV
jgi:hypothetical protein